MQWRVHQGQFYLSFATACSQGTQTIATVLDLDQRWWNGRNRKLTKEGKSTSSSAHEEQKLLPEKPLLIIEENPRAAG